MEKLTKLIRAKKGFTLVELIVVVTIISAVTVMAVPSFLRTIRVARFEGVVGEVVTLLEKARTQALASELDSAQKIPLGGYGVYLDITSNIPISDQKAILFVDDWNAAEGKYVNMSYADEVAISSRILPDGIYTDGSDSVLTTIDINTSDYIQMDELKGAQLADGASWNTASGNTVTIIFKPPYADTTITGNMSTSLQNFEVVFKLVVDDVYRKIVFNRVTTTPQLFKNK